jgi:hypothetical protein
VEGMVEIKRMTGIEGIAGMVEIFKIKGML